MKTRFLPVWLLALTLVVSGCKSVQPIADNEPSIFIQKTEHRKTGMGGSVDLPKGVYVPDFQTDKGIYYLAPTKIILGALGMHRPVRGGLFVPHKKNPDQRQAMWQDQQENSGLLTAGASSTTRIWHLDSPVNYQIQTNQVTL